MATGDGGMHRSRCDCTYEGNTDKYTAQNGCCDEEAKDPHDALHHIDARTDAMRMEKRIVAFPPCPRCLWKTCIHPDRITDISREPEYVWSVERNALSAQRRETVG